MPKLPTPQDMLDELGRRMGPVDVKVPKRFVDFCDMIGMKLHPAQRVICLVAYDGLEPRDLEGEERELARVVFGEVETIPSHLRRFLFFMCGGRGGKTYVLVSLRLLWGAYVRDLSPLAPGQRAVSLAIGPKDIHRQEIINYALGAARSHPGLKSTLVLPRGTRDDDVVSAFAIRRPDGHVVTFEGGVATRGGYGGRGRSLVDVALDEAAFFLDSGHIVNDAEIFKAASPRVLPGGQAIVSSTAYAKVGFHYDKWHENFGHPRSGLAAHATTTMLNPLMAAMVELERMLDPDNARREFDAVPMATVASIFFSSDLIESLIDKELTMPVIPEERADEDIYPQPRLSRPGDEVAAAGDLGFRSNSSALAISTRRGNKLPLSALLEAIPTEGNPLKPSVVIKGFARVMGLFGATDMMVDQHYIESAREHAGEVAIVPAPGTPSEAFIRVRTLMRSGIPQLPDPNNLPPEQAEPVRRLIKQLGEVRGTPVAGGGMSITMPMWRSGAHGDLAQGYVLSLFRLSGDVIPAPPIEDGSTEWAQAELERLQQEIREEQREASGTRRTGRR